MNPMQRTVDLIDAKRHGEELSADAIIWLIQGFVSGEVGEGQMGAFLMAGVLKGFTDAEATALTSVMVNSGATLDLSGLRGPTVDKHSTGGVGDGTTFLVAPLLAAAGAQVVKLSGRGLGHTGGTLDKLEAIPGCRVDLTNDEMIDIADRIGCVVAAQSDTLVPADRALYALRDETATVDSLALIASSVMSKKIASGAGTIVLDVKSGAGAFMTNQDAAEGLAKLCVRLGTESGRRTSALVTDMNQPLGHGVGNALEIIEVVELLQQPPQGRLATVALELAALALSDGKSMSGSPTTVDTSRNELTRLWTEGAALERLAHMIAAQGGDPQVCEIPRKILPSSPEVRDVALTRGGVCTRIPARAIGRMAAQLGGGRARKGDAIDHAVGIEVLTEVGDAVEPGDVIARVHANSPTDAEQAVEELRELVTFADEAAPIEPILNRFVSG